MLRYGLCVTKGSYSFICHPHTNHTCLYSPAARHHHPLAGTHCAYSRKDGQAELTWVAGYIPRECIRSWSSKHHCINDKSCNRKSLITKFDMCSYCCRIAYHFIHLITDTNRLNLWQSQHSMKRTCFLLHLVGLFHQRCYGFIGLSQLLLQQLVWSSNVLCVAVWLLNFLLWKYSQVILWNYVVGKCVLVK